MHVPDGFLDVPTSVATGALAALALGAALRGSRRELGEVGAVRAGLTACFIFASQMVNFPVAAGTSGHLLGGALAVALVGPWTAVLVMSCVLVVQALVFADGGVTALGTNILLMGVVGVGVAALVSRGLVALLGRRPRAVVMASAVAAFVSVPSAAAAFCLVYAIGGVVPIPLGALTLAMVGTHLLIGVGEAVITAAVVGAVLAVRPDLVRLARREASPVGAVTLPDGTVVLRPAGSGTAARPAAASGRRTGPGRRSVVVALVVSAVVAGGLSLVASTSPDGLEHVATALGFAHAGVGAAGGSGAVSPLADYDIAGLGLLGKSLAGVLGVALTLGLGLLVVRLARPRRAVARGAVPADDPVPGNDPQPSDDRSVTGEARP